MSEITNSIANIIHDRKRVVFQNEHRVPKLVVYMSYDYWSDMVKSLQHNFLDDEVFLSHGKHIMGCKIYKINDEDHPEIAIYEDFS